MALSGQPTTTTSLQSFAQYFLRAHDLNAANGAPIQALMLLNVRHRDVIVFLCENKPEPVNSETNDITQDPIFEKPSSKITIYIERSEADLCFSPLEARELV
jgi:hypothetical protein